MTKYSLLLTICCLVGSTFLSAQKAKFKGDLCVVQKTRLPLNFSEPDQRTYDLVTKGSYSGNIDAYGKKLYGWQLDQDSPKMKAVISIYGFRINSPQRQSAKKQKKDKDGKVTESWTEYWYTGSATGKGSLYIYGLSNPFDYNPKPKKKSKWEEKQEAKAKEAEKDLADNPFLTEDVIEEAAESDIGTDEGLEGANLPLVDRIGVDQSKEVETGKFRSATKAYNDYTSNKRPQLYDFKSTYPTAAYKRAMNTLNSLYGFSPVNSRFYMKRMKTEKHPDFKMWNDACQATETIFKTFKYNKAIDQIQPKFEPILSYFEKKIKSISDSDKKAKKQKIAAFQNMTNILYYMDKHDAVIGLANTYADSDIVGKHAGRILAKSEKQKALLAFHNMSSSHFETSEEAVADDIETEEAEADDDTAGTN